ncbi:MAG: hypothetical protein ACRDJC_17815 [Thermomicrobiales bacterium]
MLYENESFDNIAIDVDGKWFKNCTFYRCKIIFNGAEATKFERCTFTECQWVFDKGAEKTLEYLTALYHGLGEGGRAIVEGLFDSIRQGGVGHGILEDLPVPAARR